MLNVPEIITILNDIRLSLINRSFIVAKMYVGKQRTWHTCRYEMPD